MHDTMPLVKEMEKSTTGKRQNKFWFVALATPFGWLLLCYAYFTFPKADNSLLIFLGESFASTSKFHGSSHYYHLPNKGIHIGEENSDPFRNAIRTLEHKKKKHAKNVGRILKNGLKSAKDLCAGRYIYVHELPSRFNKDIVKNCDSLSKWTNMRDFTANLGLGPVLGEDDSRSVFSASGWFATHQFLLEVIFHNRMRKYKCLTNESSLASAIFVPYYAGLDVSRHLWFSNSSMRDAGSLEVAEWLRKTSEWRRKWGKGSLHVMSN